MFADLTSTKFDCTALSRWSRYPISMHCLSVLYNLTVAGPAPETTVDEGKLGSVGLHGTHSTLYSIQCYVGSE